MTNRKKKDTSYKPRVIKNEVDSDKETESKEDSQSQVKTKTSNHRESSSKDNEVFKNKKETK